MRGTPISPGGLSAPPRGSADLLLPWGGAFLELQSISGSGPPAPFLLLPEASLCWALALQGIQVVLPLMGGIWDCLAWGAVGASAGGCTDPAAGGALPLRATCSVSQQTRWKGRLVPVASSHLREGDAGRPSPLTTGDFEGACPFMPVPAGCVLPVGLAGVQEQQGQRFYLSMIFLSGSCSGGGSSGCRGQSSPLRQGPLAKLGRLVRVPWPECVRAGSCNETGTVAGSTGGSGSGPGLCTWQLPV